MRLVDAVQRRLAPLIGLSSRLDNNLNQADLSC